MAGQTKNTANKAGNVSGSFFEQLTDSFKSEPGKIARGMANSLIGKLPGSISEAGDYPQMSPEYMPQLKKKERGPEVQVFSFAERRENLEVKAQIRDLIQEIRREIISLEKEQKSMLNDAAKIVVENMSEKPGIYHVRFLEWILTTLRDLRKKVSESGTWFSMVVGKRKRMGFWGMAQKHGTAFTMSSERTVATQSG
jgi:hypothetical protein